MKLKFQLIIEAWCRSTSVSVDKLPTPKKNIPHHGQNFIQLLFFIYLSLCLSNAWVNPIKVFATVISGFS